MVNFFTRDCRVRIYGSYPYNLAMEWIWLAVAAVAATPGKDLLDACTHGSLLPALQRATPFQDAESLCGVALFSALVYIGTKLHAHFREMRRSLKP